MYSAIFIFSFIGLIFGLGVVLINSYRKFVLLFRVYGRPKKRDFSKTPIPNSCGVVFLFLLIIGIAVVYPFSNNPSELLAIIAGSSVISLSGFWDDLKISRVREKLVYQIIIVSASLLYLDLTITNLHGFLNIYFIPLWIGFPFSVFIGLFMINAFNLIDGIDGLAGFLGISSFTSFSVMFWTLDYAEYFGLCILMIGILAAYLPYNFSNKKKTFMGDSGSMLIGYLLFILTMTFIANREPIVEKLIDRSILPVVPMVIFFVPMIDTLSIFVYRLLNGRSPFSPDRLHMHHMMLKLFRAHSLASCCLVFLNIVLIATFSYFAFHIPSTHFQILFFTLFFFSVIILTVIRHYKRKYFTI
ncbi:MAG: Undecaprenyl-phosphate alpha-N-acetylglucosaminyl 1-phosphate transferase [Flavobacterium sp. SCGC AAA160-P02]|nr:MAG: Undecaprenyl-phosphate alpha-N-acetylglucosaminyl 1-phosphate transferase [Flavobacterium sp. SCGC AAA160-P02]